MKIDKFTPLTQQSNSKPPIIVSFHGGGRLTARFSKALYNSDATLTAINDTYSFSSKIVGSLPSEIIKDLKIGCLNKSQIQEKIKLLLTAFSDAANKLKELAELQKKKYFDYYTNEMSADKQRELEFCLEDSYFKPIPFHDVAVINSPVLDEFFPKEIKLSKQEFKKVLFEASKILSNGFKKAGLLKEKERIKIKYLDSGFYADCYSLFFPDNRYSSKVIKVFKNTEISFDINSHGLLVETNAAAFIKKARGHRTYNTETPEFYLSDIASRFMLFEHANNYTKRVKSYHDRFAITNGDSNSCNVVHGRRVDMGGYIGLVKPVVKNAVTRRTYKHLMESYDKCRSGIKNESKEDNGTLYQEFKLYIGKLFKKNDPLRKNYKSFIDMYNRYYDKASQNQVPQADDVLEALNLIKDFINKEVIQYLKA